MPFIKRYFIAGFMVADFDMRIFTNHAMIARLNSKGRKQLEMTQPIPSTDRKLKILISLLYYYPHLTGLTWHVQLVAEALVRRGHQVTVLTARYHQDLPRDTVRHNGVRVVRLWAPIRISRGMMMPAYPWALLQLMRQHDVVSIHTPMLETALVSLLAGMTGLKVIPTHHGDLVLPHSRSNRLITKIMFALYAFMAKRAPDIIGYSADYADNSYYLRPFRDKVKVIYPPICIPTPEPENVSGLRRQWQQSQGPIIGYSGRFVQEKRPDLLIRALEVINRQYPHAKIVFAGEYDIKYEDTWQRQQPLIQKFKPQLIFLGLVRDKQELADFYAACDVLVLPSDTECFALAQVEAMLCGTPVVMTDIPGGRVPVTVTGMGKLAQAGDWESIGAAVLDVLSNPDRYVKSRELIAACFSLEETVSRYEAIFREHARKPNG